jgi:hypothetical protein
MFFVTSIWTCARDQRKSLGLGKESWHDFLARLVEALRSDSLFVGLNDNEQMKLTAWCYHNGKQLSYTYTLLPCENDEVKAKVTDMVFDLLALARRKDKAHEQGTLPSSLSLSLCVYMFAHGVMFLRSSVTEAHTTSSTPAYDRADTTRPSPSQTTQSSSQAVPCSSLLGSSAPLKRSSSGTIRTAWPVGL